MKFMLRAVIGIFVSAFFSSFNAAAQVSPEAIADKNLRENTIRIRSNELERIKRDNDRPAPRGFGNSREINFAAVKEEFEKIQLLEDEIVKTYTARGPADYEKIKRKAAELSRRAERLSDNLYLVDREKNTSKQKDASAGGAGDVKTLIVKLDEKLGSFVASPIFQHLRAYDPAEAAKAQSDLDQVIILSDRLSAASARARAAQ